VEDFSIFLLFKLCIQRKEWRSGEEMGDEDFG